MKLGKTCIPESPLFPNFQAKNPSWSSKEEPRTPLPELRMPEGPEDGRQGSNTSAWPTPSELR